MTEFLLSLRLGILAYAIFFAVPTLSRAQDWSQVQKLLAKYPNGNSAAIPSMYYGQSVSISGNYAVVSAPNDAYDASGGDNKPMAGSVYVLIKEAGEWKPAAKLTAPVRNAYARFGASAAISGDYVVVGETGAMAVEGRYVGLAHIFKRAQGGAGAWGLVKSIQTRTINPGDSFGEAVDISGDFVVVGARNDDFDVNDANFVENAGAAYIYEKNSGGADNWGLVRKIAPALRELGDSFGVSVAIEGDLFVVGAPGERQDASELVPLSYTGAAYIYRKDQGGVGNWGQVKKIAPTVRAEQDWFGADVDISGNNIIVGAPFEDEDQDELNYLGDAGAAYIFSKDEGGTDAWGQVRKLTATTRTADSWFGNSVKISGDFAAVGSSYEDLDGQGQNFVSGAGGVYLFKRDVANGGQWIPIQRLSPSLRVGGDNFGKSVALSGTTLFVGAFGLAREAGELDVFSPGTVYIFQQGPALPVTLASFKVSKVENQAFLQWTTSVETNTSHFEIQKSLNAKDWTTIGTREAAKESSAVLHYTHWDSQLAAGNIYYRLKMVDQDGTFAYSSIRNLLGENGAELVAFPNPVTEKIFIKTTDSNQIAAVEIRNTAGQLVHQTTQIDGEGISVGNLVPGTYIIQIRNVNGTSAARKITISR